MNNKVFQKEFSIKVTISTENVHKFWHPNRHAGKILISMTLLQTQKYPMSRELFQIIAMKWRSEHSLLLEPSDAICELHTKITLN